MYAPTPQPLPNTPSRTGSIILLVTGLVMTFILAPLALIISSAFGVVSSAADYAHIPNSSNALLQRVENGDNIKVEDLGLVALTTLPTDTVIPTHCELKSNNHVIELARSQDNSSNATVFTAIDVPRGNYTLNCETPDSTKNFSLYYMDTNKLAKGAITGIFVGFIISIILGIAGLAMIIGGIIWLILVNKRRDEMRFAHLYQPQPPQPNN
ncbi:MAG: hypothetical protein Q4D73_07640 [Actinomycetaceae bacterium]|nr:hypothetical protein [Actinomycetaceae bacterium]